MYNAVFGGFRRSGDENFGALDFGSPLGCIDHCGIRCAVAFWHVPSGGVYCSSAFYPCLSSNAGTFLRVFPIPFCCVSSVFRHLPWTFYRNIAYAAFLASSAPHSADVHCFFCGAFGAGRVPSFYGHMERILAMPFFNRPVFRRLSSTVRCDGA